MRALPFRVLRERVVRRRLVNIIKDIKHVLPVKISCKFCDCTDVIGLTTIRVGYGKCGYHYSAIASLGRRHATRERTLALPYLEISRINSVIAEFVEISRINSVIADCCLNLRFLKRIKINIIYYNNL